MSHRFLYQNRLSSSTIITPLSAAQGVVGGAVPMVANGSGQVIFTGPFTGDGQLIYAIEIDGAGDVAAATFKWRNSDTPAGTWEASGVLTSASDVALSNGVKARFAAGAGTDFSLGDRWQATAVNPFGKRFLHGLDPNQRFRSGAPADPYTIVFDLGSAQEVKAAVLHLHNVSSGATVKIQGHTADAWGAPSLDETITWRAGTMFRYLTSAAKTYRYWRLKVEGDAANPDGWIGIGELYLGGWFEPGEDFSFGSSPDGEEAVERRQETESGVPRDVLLNRLRAAALEYEHLSDADLASFRSMFQAVKDKDNERNLPLFAHLDVDDGGASLTLYRIGGSFLPRKDGPDDNALSLSILERAA